MPAFNQSPINQQTIILGISTVNVGVGTISPVNRISNYDFKSSTSSPSTTLSSITIPIDLRPRVGLLYPR